MAAKTSDAILCAVSLDFEDARANLQALRVWFVHNDQSLLRNEATTRFQLIDRLLVECLGWPREAVAAEVHYRNEYADYALGTGSTQLLLEAKREGAYFTLPAGWPSKVCALKTLFLESSEIEAAVDQVLGYALSRGVPVASVCNGRQLIAFLASRTDGVPPRDGKALVFAGLDEMEGDFPALWDNLSPSALATMNILQTLKAEKPRLPPPKLSAYISNYPGVALRNTLQQNMRILGEIFVEDIASLEESEETFLRECYATSGALSRHSLVSREILRTRYSLLFESEADYSLSPAVTKEGPDPSLVGDIAAASLSRRPIILLGDVGVGKSTFIRHLIHVDAKEQLARAIVLYLDFGKRPALATDLDTHVRNEIVRQLQERVDLDIHEESFVRGVYHGRLRQFRTSIYGALRDSDPEEYDRQERLFLHSLLKDDDEHLRSSLEHASQAQARQVVIFLDNIDQRDPTFQDRLFVIAQTMADSWPATVFLALRPDTFNKSRREGSLAAYQPRVFTISPPRVDTVVGKRLAFALKKLRSAGLKTASGVALHVDTRDLQRYLEVLDVSLRRNDDLTECLDNVSRGNIREALGFIETFIGSGHVNTEKILDWAGDKGTPRYTVALHEFLRAILYGEGRYYSPDASPIANLFDVTTYSPLEHFLLPLVTGFLQRQGSSGGREGFVPVMEVYHFGQDLGYRPDQVASALDRAARARFVRSSGLEEGGPGGDGSWRITTLGAYAIHRLARSFVYLDAVVVDTPILDPQARGEIDDVSPFGHVRERLARADSFCSYLLTSWKPLAARNLPFDWEASASALRRDMERIWARV